MVSEKKIMKKTAVENQKEVKNKETAYQRRPNERGSALVMVLLISSLLMVASIGILLEASLNTANVTDAISEQQAFQSAESGIQTAINALRQNAVPNPLINTSSASHLDNRISFRKAVTPSISNIPGDTSTEARLSRWMNYNYTPSGVTNPDRIVLSNGTGSSYNPQTGYAYSVTVTDPDDTGNRLDFSTTGTINGQSTPFSQNGVAFTYSPKSLTTLNVSNGATPATDLGSFGVFTISGGTITADIPFTIVIDMTEPFYAQRVIRGFITKGTITSTSMGTVKLRLDSDTYELMGSEISLTGTTSVTIDGKDYEEIPLIRNSSKTISAAMTQAEPLRLMLRSVGYGPRGSQKVLEVFIRKNLFDGLTAPSTLTLVGGSSGFTFNAGQSQNVTYSGVDVTNSNIVIPPIGATNNDNLATVIANLEGSSSKADVYGTPANVNGEMPAWLKSPQALERTIAALEEKAKASGRYYTNGQTPDGFGNVSTATGVTFVNGNVSLNQDGGGILVCTGKLTLHGNFSFEGLIIVIGTGGVDRTGGGNGALRGNVVIAPYNRNNVGSDFLTPIYDMSGGGNSEMRYNSSSVGNGQEALSNFVLGVAEK